MDGEGGNSTEPFASLSPAEQEAVRQAQRRRKLEKKQAREANRRAREEAGAHGAQETSGASSTAPAHYDQQVLDSDQGLAAVSGFPDEISMHSYFAACPGGLFRDPSLPPTADSLALLLSVLQADDDQAATLNTCNYFQFAGPADAVWDFNFNARLAWEGFFTITSRRRGQREPLPELQPFYGVLTWPNFNAAKRVSAHISKMRRRLQEEGGRSRGADAMAGADSQRACTRRLRLVDCADRRECWVQLDQYHRDEHGENWLTERYFDMMVAASDDQRLNFQMHAICLVEELWEQGEDGCTAGIGGAPLASTVLAGEIGFSIGRVYTSLSGWTAARTSEAHGTSQLVLLGLWLQQKGLMPYVFVCVRARARFIGFCLPPSLVELDGAPARAKTPTQASDVGVWTLPLSGNGV